MQLHVLRKKPEGGVPFIGIDIDDLADKASQFTGDLLHPLNQQCMLIPEVHTTSGIPGRLSYTNVSIFLKR